MSDNQTTIPPEWGTPVGAGDGGTFIPRPVYHHQLARYENLLVETVEAMRDLAGALIDNLPPQAQQDVADVQVKLLKAMEAFRG